MKEKIIWINNLRAFATIAVILLHVSAPILYEYNKISSYIWNIGNIIDGSVRWCVPIFFMITGALLLNEDHLLANFLKKRVIRILPPFIFWSLIYITYDNFILNKDSLDLMVLIKTFLIKLFEGSSFHFWFVYVLIGLYLVIPILRKFVKYSTNKELFYFLTIWLFAITFNHPHLKIYLPKINLDFFSGYIGYLVLGYFLSKYTIKNKFIPFLLFLLGSLITVIGTLYISFVKNEFSEFLYNYLRINIIISSIGFFLIVKKLVIKNILINRILAIISDYSYGIYLVHILVLSILNFVGVNWTLINPLVGISITTISCILISCSIIYLLRRVKIGNYIAG